jgi:tripartite ATP-independent transporter DctM subunit
MLTLLLMTCTVITLLIGIPVVFSLGISATLSILVMGDIPLQVIPQKIYAGMDSFPLLCIPFFILAGELMSHGRITEALLRFAVLLVGRIPGGLAIANVLASMFFGGMTGSAIADVSALGSVEIPMMVKAGYSPRFSAAITCASAMIGPVIPPSIPVVVYALAAGASIGGLFLAGVIPGILVGFALIIASYLISVKRRYPVRREPFSFRELWLGFKRVFLALILPFIIVGGIISGIFTPTEASAVAVGYAFFVTVIITRQIRLPQLPGMLIRSGIVTAIVMLVVGTATVWGWVVAIEQVASRLAEFLSGTTPLTFLLLTNIFLLFLGTFMDNIPAIIIFGPTLAPVAQSLGIDPLHFGLIFCLNTTLGLITPPLGEVLFIACPIANIRLEDLSSEIFIFFLVEVAVLFIVTYLPFTTLWVPRLFGF